MESAGQSAQSQADPLALTGLEYSQLQDHYSTLDLYHHVEILEQDQQRQLLIHDDYGKLTVFARIELMVEQIQHSKELAFELLPGKKGKPTVVKKQFSGYYSDAKIVREMHGEEYFYSPKIRAFFDAWNSMSEELGRIEMGRPQDSCPFSGWYGADVFNALIAKIRLHCRTSKYATRLRKHRNNCRRALGSFLAWEADLFRPESRSRHLMVLVHLGYLKEHRTRVTPELIQTHLDRMLDKTADPVLNGVRDYAWRIEEGKQTGLHIHLLVSYDTWHNDSVGVARELGEYWKVRATQGMGRYWNGNADGLKQRGKGGGAGLGLGKINHNDLLARTGLRKILAYMAKSSQYLTRKSGPKYKSFGLSRPEEKKVRGRPRRKNATRDLATV